MAARKTKSSSSRSQHKDSRRAGSRNGRSMRTRARSSRSSARSKPELDQGKLLEFLAEMLAVEKGGVMLYEKALEELSDEDLRDDLEEFLEETRHHVELCEQMLEQAGGSADQASPGAEAAEAKAKGLISVEVPEELTDFNNIENLVLAETKDNWDWEMLAEMAKSIKDRELRSTVSRAVREVTRQERRHVDWNRATLSALARQMMEHKAESEEMAEEARP